MSTFAVLLPLDETSGTVAKDARATTPVRTVTSARAVLIDDGDANCDGTLALAGNGDFLKWWSKGPTRTVNSVLVQSRCLAAADPYNPANWSAPVTIANHNADPTPRAVGVSGCALLPSGRLVLAYDTVDATPDPTEGHTENHTYVMVSDDHAATWGAPLLFTQLTHEFGVPTCSHYSRAYRLPSGRLLFPLYGADTWADWESGGGVPTNVYLRIVKSDDNGATWQYLATAIPKTAGYYFSEANFVEWSDGTLCLLVRTKRTLSGSADHTLFGVLSGDGGLNWSVPFVMFGCGGLMNAPLIPQGLVNTDKLPLLMRSGSGNLSPLLIETGDDGKRWCIRQNLYDAAGEQSLGGGFAPKGTELLAVYSTGSGLLGSKINIMGLSAPGVRANGDNPGTASGDVTVNQGALLTGTGSFSFFTDGNVECPTSPVLESLLFGAVPGFRFEAELKLTEQAGFTDYWIASLISNAVPSQVVQVFVEYAFGAQYLKCTVGTAGSAQYTKRCAFAFATGTAYKVAVELVGTAIRMWIGTDPNNLIEQAVTLESGTPALPYDTAFSLIKLRVGNNVSANSPLKGQLANVALAALPQIVTDTLPDGTTGTPYTGTLFAAQGEPPYTWSVASGALPAGLSLAADTGIISGTPTAGGLASFTARVTDANGQTADQALTFDVASGTFGRLFGGGILESPILAGAGVR
jgi:hypothetical protein